MYKIFDWKQLIKRPGLFAALLKNMAEDTITILCDCGEPATYSSWEDGYDAHYCAACNKWLYPVCSDPECQFCKDRPEKPFKEDE